MKNFILLFLLLLPLQSAIATTLKKLFTENFYTIHRPGYCGQNILNFLKLADEKGVDLRGAEIINVDGGWVSPLFVRNQRGEPEERYFYFHIFLIHEGHVYDFDYGNTPVVPKIGDYFKKMWITGKERDRFLYLKTFDATEYLQGKPMPKDAPSFQLLKFANERSR